MSTCTVLANELNIDNSFFKTETLDNMYKETSRVIILFLSLRPHEKTLKLFPYENWKWGSVFPLLFMNYVVVLLYRNLMYQ